MTRAHGRYLRCLCVLVIPKKRLFHTSYHTPARQHSTHTHTNTDTHTKQNVHCKSHPAATSIRVRRERKPPTGIHTWFTKLNTKPLFCWLEIPSLSLSPTLVSNIYAPCIQILSAGRVCPASILITLRLSHYILTCFTPSGIVCGWGSVKGGLLQIVSNFMHPIVVATHTVTTNPCHFCTSMLRFCCRATGFVCSNTAAMLPRETK